MPQGNKKWNYPKVSIRTFIDNPFYLNIKNETYPKIKDICENIIEGKFTEAVEVAGIGAGKSFSAEILACYSAHHLLCLAKPHHYYHLTRDKKIAILNMGVNATQANETVFSGIRSFIEKSLFFQQFSPRILEGSITFEKEKIFLFSGNSKVTTPLGYNIFCAVLDEAAFYLDNENKSNAEEIYTAMQRRIVSRFGNEGLIAAISSPRYVGDFVMRKLEEARRNKKIYGVQLPTWKVKSLESQDIAGKFYLNTETGEMQDDKPNKDTVDLITDKDFKPLSKWWEIPGEYKKSFISNVEKAKRDFGAMPSLTLEAFDMDSQVIERECNTERESPIDKQGRFKDWFKCEDEENRYIHIDLGLKKDACGICMCSPNGIDSTGGDNKLKVKIDLMLQIKPPEGGEIRFKEVRQIVYSLEQRGFNIAKVTLDSWQCFRKGTKIPIITFDKFQSLIYNEGINNKQKFMPLKGNTSISLLSGVDRNIEDIKAGDYVYSINKHGDVGFGKVKKVWLSGKKEIYRVTLDNGNFIDCSGNHPFMMRDGSYKQVIELKIGDSLMPLYRKEGMADLKNYEMVLHPRGKWEYTHRAIMRQKNEIRRGKVIHHKNAIKKDNTPENLVSLSYKEHGRNHKENGIKGFKIARERLANNTEAQERRNKALAETSRRNWRENPEKLKKALAEGNKKRWAKKEEHIKMSKFISERNLEMGLKPMLGKKHTLETKKKISFALKKKWQESAFKEIMKNRPVYYDCDSPKYDKKLSFEDVEKCSNLKLKDACVVLNTTKRKIRHRLKQAGFNSWIELKKTKNHKIVKIECLNIKDDVYDIEVEDNHNFAVSAGVFVHNSVDSIQLFEDKGYESEILSVDRTIEPYNTLKELLHTGRLDFYKFEPFEKEYACLELVKGKKVDHSPLGSKDVCDAICGACYSCIQNEQEEGEPDIFIM